ncbi:DUF4301 family protein [uncultured Muribaculum sp.]|uniref:DUF4301 family protein n=1 Tax=uncultured Muribaculum sp. TaxID=1918613 RepID=UPI0026E081EA|nr:DUF4301 family protein [uncultured Muribaculum sp.]
MQTNDLKQLEAKGISPDVFDAQLRRFNTGFPYLRIVDSARVGEGIKKLTPDEEQRAIDRWEQYCAHGGEAFKFVPASGAASRMFKSLFAFVEGNDVLPVKNSDVDLFIRGLHKMPFYNELDTVCVDLYGQGIEPLLDASRHKDVVSALLRPEGLNYGQLPKGLLLFHSYSHGSRTPLEEHLVEGAQTAADKNGNVKLHFTVSPEHWALFEKHIADVVPVLEARHGVKYNISLSEQKPSTDTVAANADNTPFRQDDGSLLFRPGGHGALIENLNDIDSAVVFIKNIDNVVPDSQRDATIRYKKVIAGYLMEVHDKIEEYVRMIDSGNYDIEQVREMISFLHNTLNIRDSKLKELEDVDLVLYIRSKLNRPVRVCGMVRNEGEPGGGPYIAYNPDGSTSPQILEGSQIDPANGEYKAMVAKATHFNPVDLVCYIKDIEGNKFNLPDFVDPDTGFISEKSKNGRELKALELPGLWNGAMSQWNTVFVEVPIATFNPVKTVNDLLRPMHQ